MDEAKRVLERLDRIRVLRSSGAATELLLAELRELVHEGEAWVRVEGTGVEAASAAVVGLAEALAASTERAGRREVVAAEVRV